jgi:hypothetical protein
MSDGQAAVVNDGHSSLQARDTEDELRRTRAT